MYTESLLFSQSQQLEDICESPIITCIDAVLISNHTEVSIWKDSLLVAIKGITEICLESVLRRLIELSKLCYLGVVITAYNYHDMDVITEQMLYP